MSKQSKRSKGDVCWYIPHKTKDRCKPFIWSTKGAKDAIEVWAGGRTMNDALPLFLAGTEEWKIIQSYIDAGHGDLVIPEYS